MNNEQLPLLKEIIVDAAENELLPRFNQCSTSFKTDSFERLAISFP